MKADAYIKMIVKPKYQGDAQVVAAHKNGTHIVVPSQTEIPDDDGHTHTIFIRVPDTA